MTSSVPFPFLSHAAGAMVQRFGLLAALAIVLASCAGSAKLAPTPLQKFSATLTLEKEWVSQLGEMHDSLRLQMVAGQVAFANAQGVVGVLQAQTGKDLWRMKLPNRVSAGVGFDGQILAVVTDQNEVLALRAGKVEWRAKLSTPTYTPPLVAGQRVFVLGSDRTLSAFDSQSGAKLWSTTRTSDSLTLRQPVVLFAHQNTLLVGMGARLAAVSPNNGQVQWETTVAQVRGINDIERLVELLATPNRVDTVLCMRAYQHSVACLDAQNGVMKWSKASQGATAVAGNEDLVVGTQSDGRVSAWSRKDGAPIWTVDKLAHRDLSSPLLVGRSIVVGDLEGVVHVLSKDDGAFLARFTTDGSPIVAAPLLFERRVLVVTQKGGLYALTPQ